MSDHKLAKDRRERWMTQRSKIRVGPQYQAVIPDLCVKEEGKASVKSAENNPQVTGGAKGPFPYQREADCLVLRGSVERKEIEDRNRTGHAGGGVKKAKGNMAEAKDNEETEIESRMRHS